MIHRVGANHGGGKWGHLQFILDSKYILGDDDHKIWSQDTINNFLEIQILKAIATYDFKWLEDNGFIEEIKP